MPGLRSIAAVLAGFLLMTMVASVAGAITGMLGGALVVSLIGSVIAAVTGGWAAARVGSHAPFQHAAALAILIAFMTIIVWANTPAGTQPAWYLPVVGVIGVLGVLAGGRIRASASAAGHL
jgi:hypothetical protein